MVAAYDGGKLVNFIWRQYQILAPQFASEIRRKLVGLIYHLGDCPMSDKPPDAASTLWGLKGCNDGLEPLK